MSQNPYASPSSSPISSSSGQQHGVELVSQGKRFVNYLVDRILLTVGSLALGVALGVVLGVSDPNGAVVNEAMIDIIGYVIGFVFVFLYFVFFEWAFKKPLENSDRN